MLSRLKREHKLAAELGPLQIAYRECPVLGPKPIKFTHSGKLDSKLFAQVQFSLNNLGQNLGTNLVSMDKHLLPEGAVWKSKFQKMLNQSLHQALNRSGRLIYSPVCNVNLHLDRLLLSDAEQSSEKATMNFASNNRLQKDPALQSNVKQFIVDCLHKSLNDTPSWNIMEPVMRIEIFVPREFAGNISIGKFLSELSHRNAEIISVDGPGAADTKEHEDDHQIVAEAPLSSLKGFSSAIRALSHGIADLHIQVTDYRPVSIATIEAGHHPDKELMHRLKMTHII
ncbi:G elongation factor, mitochondrial 2 [Cichlidogyrus casuarinus]|uniref:G elongation factor, mitochondrial 2 n=1 Tax=Cichlidogyrus casuarinus TaxID=1844966 RepID=A0ABD2PQA2_9PLAT